MVDAAWDNLIGMERARAATLALIEAETFEQTAAYLVGELPGLLRVDSVKLLLAPSRRCAKPPSSWYQPYSPTRKGHPNP